jgi:hypothetical protein
MKTTSYLFFAGMLSTAAVCISSAANLTGDGYIYVTKPTTAWTPPNNVYNTPRFLWYPDKAAFRFGDQSSDNDYFGMWNPEYIGAYSFAGGLSTYASGSMSFAFGYLAAATGSDSTAMGLFSRADGSGSIALGSDATSLGGGSTALGSGAYASGGASLALGGGATGECSVGIGMGGWASGDYSVSIAAMDSASATGGYSMAIGNAATAAGSSSTAFGTGAEALADFSTALGNYAYTTSQFSVAVGTSTVSNRRNGSAASPGTPQDDDPVFMVSKGPLDPWTTPPTRNALTIYRNGDSHFNGIVRVMPGGDIPMTGYTSKPSGVQFP